MNSNQVLFVLLAISIFVLVFDLLRRSVLREKYSIVWIVTALAFLIFAFWPNVIVRLSKFLGFEAPSNFILGVVIIFLLAVVMQLSLEISRLEDNIQTLADESALLRNRKNGEQNR